MRELKKYKLTELGEELVYSFFLLFVFFLFRMSGYLKVLIQVKCSVIFSSVQDFFLIMVTSAFYINSCQEFPHMSWSHVHTHLKVL